MKYQSQYPPAHNATYVKATELVALYYPYFATDPAKSLTGSFDDANTYVAPDPTEWRFHIDLGSPKHITRIYYQNLHNSGGTTNMGVRHFTFWGSNTASAFAELTYATNTNWTQLTCSASEFDQHVAADQSDPKYITVTNTMAYRYYAFKFADNWGNVSYLGIRRIELQSGVFGFPPVFL